MGVRLALYSDMLVATRDAKFQITETPRGLDSTPFWMMLDALGAGMFASEVCLTGRSWTGEEAAKHGLLTRMCEPGEHLKAAEADAHDDHVGAAHHAHLAYGHQIEGIRHAEIAAVEEEHADPEDEDHGKPEDHVADH